MHFRSGRSFEIKLMVQDVKINSIFKNMSKFIYPLIMTALEIFMKYFFFLLFNDQKIKVGEKKYFLKY